MCMKMANEKNPSRHSITDEARATLIALSEGYPHFIQQFGYSTFKSDSDNSIDNEDVGNGMMGPSGGLELIGERYYRNDFYNKML